MVQEAGSRHDRRNDLSRLASVGQIAAGIAHEVQNPLTSVKGFLQLLQRENPHKYLDVAQSELEHAIAALQRLLKAAKPDLDNEPPQYFNPCVELESILTLFPGQTDRVRIRKEFRDHHVRLYGKKHQLKKAFYNVLKNAFEAIPGEGTITIRQRASETEMTLEIADTGVGIPEDKLDLLGTPFYTTKFGGTGMGLAQVYATVYQHGGSIEVHSEENAGTTFILHLPLQSGFREETAFPDLLFSTEMDFLEFLECNRSKFEWALLQRAADMTALSETQEPGAPAEWEPAADMAPEADPARSGDLLDCTHRLIRLIIDKQEYDIVLLAAEQGRAWASRRHPDFAAMVAWYRAVRRTVWTFLVYYDRLGQRPRAADSFHAMERQINDGVDLFLQHACFHYLEEQNRKWRQKSQGAGAVMAGRDAGGNGAGAGGGDHESGSGRYTAERAPDAPEGTAAPSAAAVSADKAIAPAKTAAPSAGGPADDRFGDSVNGSDADPAPAAGWSSSLRSAVSSAIEEAAATVLDDRPDPTLAARGTAFGPNRTAPAGFAREPVCAPQIIPLSPTIGLLPLCGSLDAEQTQAVLNRVLRQLEVWRPASMFVDLAQTALLDATAAELFLQMLDSILLMGPDIVVTGVRAETARLLVQAGFRPHDRTHNRIHVGSTLQQALARYGLAGNESKQNP